MTALNWMPTAVDWISVNIGVSAVGAAAFLGLGLIERWRHRREPQNSPGWLHRGMVIRLMCGLGTFWSTLVAIYIVKQLCSPVWFSRLSLAISDVGNLVVLYVALTSRADNPVRELQRSLGLLGDQRAYFGVGALLVVVSVLKAEYDQHPAANSSLATELSLLLIAPSQTLAVVALAGLAVTMASRTGKLRPGQKPGGWLCVAALLLYAALQVPAYYEFQVNPARLLPGAGIPPIVAILAIGKLCVLVGCGAVFGWLLWPEFMARIPKWIGRLIALINFLVLLWEFLAIVQSVLATTGTNPAKAVP